MDTTIVGILPQTRQTWRDKPVRELFAEIVSDHPRAGEETLRRYFREAAKDDPDYLDAIIDYAFDAAFRSHQKLAEREAEKKLVSAKDKADAAKKRAAELEAHAERVEYLKEKIILLNQEMPNGKRARNCTLDYMYRLGGAFRSVGKRGSAKLVGEAYSEDDYREKLHGLVG